MRLTKNYEKRHPGKHRLQLSISNFSFHLNGSRGKEEALISHTFPNYNEILTVPESSQAALLEKPSKDQHNSS